MNTQEHEQFIENLKKRAIEWVTGYDREIIPICKGKKGDYKQPMLNWKTQRLRDVQQIETFFDVPENTAKITGIAITLGEGVTCIDVDVHGANGYESLKKWESEHGKLAPTLTETTPSGGKHLYYCTQVPDNKRHIKVLDSLDVLSNGYVIVEPSKGLNGGYTRDTNGAHYAENVKYENNSVFELIQYAINKKDAKNDDNAVIQQDTENSNKLAIQVGERTNYLVKQIAKMKDGTFTDESIKVAIYALNNQLDEPLTDDELQNEVFPSIENFDDHMPKKVDAPLSENDIQSMIVHMTDVEELETEWLVNGWIPKGAITLLGGDGGLGKGFIWCNIVSALSNGKPCLLENQTRDETEPKRTLILSSEDDANRTIVKRLNKCGANLRMIDIVPMKDKNFGKINFDSELLYKLLNARHYDLVIFDPLQNFIEANADMAKRNTMRKVLQPLLAYTEETGTTALIIMHTNKRTGVSGRGRFADSADIYDIARSALLLGRTQEKDKRYIDHAKSNLGEMQKTVLYTVHDGMAKYCGTSDKKDADFLQMRSARKDEIREDTKSIIIDVLSNSEYEKLESKALKKAVEESADFELKDRSYKRALKELKEIGRVEVHKIGNGKGRGLSTIYELKPLKVDVGTALDFEDEID